MSGPQVGERAPDATLQDLDGREVELSSLWRRRPAVIVFLRYFGCPFCQSQVVALRSDEERIRSAGAGVGLVGRGRPEDARDFVTDKKLPFPLLLDPDGDAYRAYGLAQSKAFQVLRPQVTVPWVKLNLDPETRQRGLKGGSFSQLPGTFVVDISGVLRAGDGLVRMAHRSAHVADIPSNEDILAALALLKPTG